MHEASPLPTAPGLAAASDRARVAPGSAKAWLLAARPKTLAAAVAPVAVGTAAAYAESALRAGPAIAALLGAMLLQIGANFANDVFDFEKGADTHERLGPTRAVQAGLVSPAAMRRAMALVFGLALLVGVYLTVQAGPVIVAIGLLSIAAAIAYTGGPYPLGYHGLGDICVFVFFGWVAVLGSTFVHTGQFSELSFWVAIPMGALATAILVVNNLRDRETDARAGKRTLAVRLGRRGALFEYQALLAVSYAVPILLLLRRFASVWILLPLLTAPLGVYLVRRVRREQGRALNPLLGATARLVFLFGFALAAGIALGTQEPPW